MDPLSAISLASSIVQFVQFGLQIVDRLQDLTAKHPGQVPRALQGISMHLPLLTKSLSKMTSDSRVGAFDFDTRCILKGIVSGCLGQVREVEAMLQEIACAPGDSLKTKLKKVVTSVKYQEKLARIERNLNTYISVLVLHHVVDSADAPRDLVDETYYDVREKLADGHVERKGLVEQLDAHLYDASRSQVTSPTVLLLSGSKGAGKTQLALGYCRAAHELQQFRTVFWLDASTLENLSLGFERIFGTPGCWSSTTTTLRSCTTTLCMTSGENGDTVLMIAVAAKHEKVVEVLLENGADVELANTFGEIALDIAEQGNFKHAIKLLGN
ncbi:hypothetical protein MY1884_009495 [Beauveria asiatica]